MDRRKKKNKVMEIIINDNSDSDSTSSYDFSSSLNRDYISKNLPDDIEKSKSAPLLTDVKEDGKLIRFLIEFKKTFLPKLHNFYAILRKKINITKILC